MKYAVVKGEDVINLILWDNEEEYEAPEGCRLLPVDDDEFVSTGWFRRSGHWVKPEEPEPIPTPEEDPEVLEAKTSAFEALKALGIPAASARLIVGLNA